MLKIRKNLVRVSGCNAGDSRKELEQIKKNIPTKAEDFLDGFGETVVLSAGASKGPATLVSREPGELATIIWKEISQ